jgi:hypothetical protein
MSSIVDTTVSTARQRSRWRDKLIPSHDQHITARLPDIVKSGDRAVDDRPVRVPGTPHRRDAPCFMRIPLAAATVDVQSIDHRQRRQLWRPLSNGHLGGWSAKLSITQSVVVDLAFFVSW